MRTAVSSTLGNGFVVSSVRAMSGHHVSYMRSHCDSHRRLHEQYRGDPHPHHGPPLPIRAAKIRLSADAFLATCG
jgi:hypothetical protein